ncbi:MAG TPA: hypothetical protein PLV04_00995 [Phenylobacterium sp.]|nr:hypothetical protein [Phenylobacterium sp.]HQN49642.1 hypothetical protein [Phenylobacterium sp.]
MIAHFSIPARDPRSAAEVFGKLIDGAVMPFPVVDGAWVAIARDGSGIGVEVVPAATAHHMGQGEAGAAAQGPFVMPWETQIRQDGDETSASGFHVAMTSPLSAEEIVALGRAAGWRAVHCDRGDVFDLVELWVDNRSLVEVLPPEGARRYRDFYRPEVAGAMFGQPA